jgi:hypothetical protein
MRLKLPELSKKEWIIVGVCSAVLITAIGAITAYAYFQHRDTTTSCIGSLCGDLQKSRGDKLTQISPTPSPTPTLLPSKLNGSLVTEGSESLRPLAVMIENHPEARPQSGLGQADVVYEAVAEGGITRFMALFGDARNAVRVGPIRSARPYFVDFATEYKAFYSHVGGNATALDQIRATGVYDLDQFALGEPTYKRDFSRKVATEHTMYSSTEKLWDVAVNQRKWGTNAEYESLTFTTGVSPDKRPVTGSVSVNFSTPSFLVEWQYNPTTNTYLRNMGGKPHQDAIDSKQIEVSAIILQNVVRTPLVTRINEKGWKFQLTGSGKATIVQNGTQQNATWKKNGTERTRFYAESGEEIALVAGKHWFTMVHSDVAVTIK